MLRTRVFNSINCGQVNTQPHHDCFVCALLSQACTSLCFFRLHNVNHTQAFFSGAYNQQAGCTRGLALSFTNLVVSCLHYSTKQQSSTRAGFLSSVVLLKAIERFPDCAKQSAISLLSITARGTIGTNTGKSEAQGGNSSGSFVDSERLARKRQGSRWKPCHLSTHLQSNGRIRFSGSTYSLYRWRCSVNTFNRWRLARKKCDLGTLQVNRCSADTFFTHSFFCRPLTIRLLSGKWSAHSSNKLASYSLSCPASDTPMIRLLARFGALDSFKNTSYLHNNINLLSRFSGLAHMLQLILRLRVLIPLRGIKNSLKILAEKIDPPLRGVYLAKIRSGGILQ